MYYVIFLQYNGVCLMGQTKKKNNANTSNFNHCIHVLNTTKNLLSELDGRVFIRYLDKCNLLME